MAGWSHIQLDEMSSEIVYYVLIDRLEYRCSGSKELECLLEVMKCQMRFVTSFEKLQEIASVEFSAVLDGQVQT